MVQWQSAKEYRAEPSVALLFQPSQLVPPLRLSFKLVGVVSDDNLIWIGGIDRDRVDLIP